MRLRQRKWSALDRSPRSGPLPLPSLSIGNPSDVRYLMPVRAERDFFLAWLQANPESPRAQLENHVVVVYPQGTDTTRHPVNGHVALGFLMFVLPGLAAWRLRASGSRPT